MSNIRNKQRPCGVTLVELLVVITILVLVVAVVLPLAQPVLRSRGVREASRQINAFFAAAQARAMAEGRPYGVMIKRDPSNPNRAFELVTVKAPGVYAGDSSATYSKMTTHPWQHALFGASAILRDGFLNKGDIIRFAYRGPFYQITDIRIRQGAGPGGGVLGGGGGAQPDAVIQFAPLLWTPDPNNPLVAYDSTTPTQVAPPTLAPDVVLPFAIVRQPRPTSAKPLVLPQGTFIDLARSGIGTKPVTTGHFVDDPSPPPDPVIIMYNPDGSVGTVYAHVQRDLDLDGVPEPEEVGPYRFQANDGLYLLVSRPLSNSTDSLSLEADSLWIGVSQKMGRVSTYQNVGATGANEFNRTRLARENSTQVAQTIGGR